MWHVKMAYTQRQLPLIPFLSHNDLLITVKHIAIHKKIMEKNQHSVFKIYVNKLNTGQCSLLISVRVTPVYVN